MGKEISEMFLIRKHEKGCSFSKQPLENFVCKRSTSLAYDLLGSVLSDLNDVIQVLLA